MLSQKYIMNLLREYASSPAGKKQIKKKYGAEYVGTYLTKSQMKQYGEKLKATLLDYITPLIKSITADDIIVGEPWMNKKTKEWRLNISFNEENLARKSLVPGQRLNNIVLLFTKGYHASRQVYGEWVTPNGTKYIASRVQRDPNDFLQRAVDMFNAESNGVVKAQLSGRYKI